MMKHAVIRLWLICFILYFILYFTGQMLWIRMGKTYNAKVTYATASMVPSHINERISWKSFTTGM